MSTKIQSYLENTLEKKFIEFIAQTGDVSNPIQLGCVTTTYESEYRQVKKRISVPSSLGVLCSFGGSISLESFSATLVYVVYSDYSVLISLYIKDFIKQNENKTEVYVQKSELKTTVNSYLETLDSLVNFFRENGYLDKDIANLSKQAIDERIEGITYCFNNIEDFQYFSIHAGNYSILYLDLAYPGEESDLIYLEDDVFWTDGDSIIDEVLNEMGYKSFDNYIKSRTGEITGTRLIDHFKLVHKAYLLDHSDYLRHRENF